MVEVKVYVLQSVDDECGCFCLEGVFSSEEKAIEFAAKKFGLRREDWKRSEETGDLVHCSLDYFIVEYEVDMVVEMEEV